MVRLKNKEQIKEAIRAKFGDDPRITDEFLFDGKRMTLSCYILLKSIYPYRYNSCALDSCSHHCYVTFTAKGEEVKRTPELAEKIQALQNRLESILSDDECYFISDCISGEREHGEGSGNTGYIYGQGTYYLTIDMWVFASSADMLDFADSNDAKCKLLLETE